MWWGVLLRCHALVDDRIIPCFQNDAHQQYMVVHPNGYCPNHSTGVRLPNDWAVRPLQYVD